MTPGPNIDAIAARLDAGESVSAVAADVGVTERTIREHRYQRQCCDQEWEFRELLEAVVGPPVSKLAAMVQ